MTPYFAAAVQSVFTGTITLIAAAMMANGITADVTAMTMLAVGLSYAATLMISVVRNLLIRSISEEDLKMKNSNEVEPAEHISENPWVDPALVENAKSFMNEEENRESIRAFWRRSGSGRASFRDAHAPIVNFVQKG